MSRPKSPQLLGTKFLPGFSGPAICTGLEFQQDPLQIRWQLLSDLHILTTMIEESHKMSVEKVSWTPLTIFLKSACTAVFPIRNCWMTQVGSVRLGWWALVPGSATLGATPPTPCQAHASLRLRPFTKNAIGAQENTNSLMHPNPNANIGRHMQTMRSRVHRCKHAKSQ